MFADELNPLLEPRIRSQRTLPNIGEHRAGLGTHLGTVFGCWPRGLGYGYITVFEPTTTSGVHRGSSDMHAAKPSTLPSFCKGRAHLARESYDSRVRNLRAVALFAATGASVALIGAPIAAADNGPGQPQCSGPPGACPTYDNAPINTSPPTRPPAFFVPYDGARYPYGN